MSGVNLRDNFYRPALSAAEQQQMDAAREVDGLADEIAMMRVRLRTLLDEEKLDARLLTLAMNALVKAVAVQYRLSPKAREDLAANFAAALNSFADQLALPEA